MKKSKLKKVLLITGIVLGVFVVAILGYGYYLYSSVQQTAKEVYHPLKKDKSNNTSSSSANDQKAGKTSKATKVVADPLKSKKSNAINILLLGVDQRPGDHGRSDTMIVATLNPKKHSLMMTSIPRDTRIHLSGHGAYSKINAAYAYGNESLAVQTVENYLNINIPFYVKINMQGLSDLVNAVGGVTVHNSLDWYNGTIHFHYKKGTLHLNGKEALAYSRMRHQDPRGDFGRNQRQRQVIQAVIDKGKSLTGVTHINSVLNTVGNNVQTNLTFSDMKDLAMKYRQCRQNIANYEVKGTPKYIGGISWVLVSKQERQHVHGMIEAALSK